MKVGQPLGVERLTGPLASPKARLEGTRKAYRGGRFAERRPRRTSCRGGTTGLRGRPPGPRTRLRRPTACARRRAPRLPAAARGAGGGTARGPKPVAITVTRTSSFTPWSMTAPKMTFAFWSAAPVTTSAASFTSNRPMSGPPVTLSRIPVAPSIDASRSGDETACSGRLAGAVLAGGDADAHQRRARVAHDRPHVGEVEVDEAGDRDQVGDALDSLAQDVVGHPERVDDRGVLVDHLEQPVVLDHDQRVDVLAQVADTQLRLLGALAAFEGERPRDDADGDRLELARELGDSGCRARAGAATFAGGHEHHVRALQRLLQLVAALMGGGPPDLGIRARAEPAGRTRCRSGSSRRRPSSGAPGRRC